MLITVVLGLQLHAEGSAGTGTELLGPAVNVAHRLLKNSIQARIGYRPYLFLTDAAASGLNLAEPGVEHREDYGTSDPSTDVS
jgi:hypothetical protein